MNSIGKLLTPRNRWPVCRQLFAELRSVMSEQFEHAAFVENLGSKFLLKLEGSDSAELELVEVSEQQKGANQEMFSVVFRCRSETVWPQGIYHLAHERMGGSDLFLVPINKDAEGVYYEAVFNRVFEA